MSQTPAILQSLPIGQKIGIAFSGGLDTSGNPTKTTIPPSRKKPWNTARKTPA